MVGGVVGLIVAWVVVNLVNTIDENTRIKSIFGNGTKDQSKV